MGLFLGGFTWLFAHFGGAYVTNAECNAAGSRWDMSNPAWEGTLLGIAIASLVLAEVCAVIVFLRTRGIEFGDGPPEEGIAGERRPTRIHFFSAASIPANLIFLMIVTLDLVGNLANVACRQS